MKLKTLCTVLAIAAVPNISLLAEPSRVRTANSISGYDDTDGCQYIASDGSQYNSDCDPNGYGDSYGNGYRYSTVRATCDISPSVLQRIIENRIARLIPNNYRNIRVSVRLGRDNRRALIGDGTVGGLAVSGGDSDLRYKLANTSASAINLGCTVQVPVTVNVTGNILNDSYDNYDNSNNSNIRDRSERVNEQTRSTILVQGILR